MHGTLLGDAITVEPSTSYYDYRPAPGIPRDTVVFHYAPESHLQLRDFMPRPESQHPEHTPEIEIIPDSPRSPDVSSLQALHPLVTERVTDESASHEDHSEDHANQGDVKPPRTSAQSKKRTIEEVKPEVSDNDNSDVGELSLEDQLAYARIKAQLTNVRKTKIKRIKSEHDVKPVLSGDAQLANVRRTKITRIKSEHDVKPVLSGDVIVLSD